MAGNRLHNLGTIYTRINGLMRAGALDPAERPLWFDIYKRFPPKDEPLYERAVPQNIIRTILYPEDSVRSRFYKEFGSPGVISLNSADKSPCIAQKFITKYNEILKTITNEDEAFLQASHALRAQGILLKTSAERAVDDFEVMKKKLKAETKKQTSLDTKKSADFKATVQDLFGDNVARKPNEDDDLDSDGIYIDDDDDDIKR